MCDYSLHGVKNRLAIEGDSLVVHRFHTGSNGLASVAELEHVQPHWLKRLLYRVAFMFDKEIWEAEKSITAVCVPPGARLYVDGIPKAIREQCRLSEAGDAVFTQITAESFRHRDAFRFAGGIQVVIQKFPEGVRVSVLSLALEEEREEAGCDHASSLTEREVIANG